MVVGWRRIRCRRLTLAGARLKLCTEEPDGAERHCRGSGKEQSRKTEEPEQKVGDFTQAAWTKQRLTQLIKPLETEFSKIDAIEDVKWPPDQGCTNV